MTKYELEQREKQYKKYVITTNFINQEKKQKYPGYAVLRLDQIF